MELNSNQVVVFEDGHTEGFLEARWSNRNKAFYSFNEDGEKIFSTTVIEKPSRKRKKFVPSKDNCKIEINPVMETEKAYGLYDGTNGCMTKQNMKIYYKFVAKSVCHTTEDGKIFAPSWAV